VFLWQALASVQFPIFALVHRVVFCLCVMSKDHKSRTNSGNDPDNTEFESYVFYGYTSVFVEH